MWNLAVGLGLVGCSAGPITNAEGQSTSTTATESGATGDGEGEGDGEGDGDGDECVGDYNCGYYSNCVDGECVPWECINGYECDLFEVCSGETCVSIGEPPPACPFDLLDIPTELQVGEPVLALSFIDLDDDGPDDLVVATETELLLYQFGADSPTIVPREPSSTEVDSMAVGQFDDQPGEDLLLLVGADMHRYFSDGAGNLVNPTVEPSPSPESWGLIAADLDGQPPTDLLIWGWDFAELDFGGMSVPLVAPYPHGAGVFPLGSSNPGLAVNTANDLMACNVHIFDLMGNFVDDEWVCIDGSLIAIETPDAAAYVGVNKSEGYEQLWSELLRLDPNTGAHRDTILIADAPTLVAADLDGDLYTEIVAGGGVHDRLRPARRTLLRGRRPRGRHLPHPRARRWRP